jgi:3-oxoacyl-[acyl-carrier-protein] synthase II
MARLLAYGRVFPDGLLSAGVGGVVATQHPEPGVLRAKFFFDQPYPKYGRMDGLCKVAVAAAQLAIKAGGIDEPDEVAQVGGTMLGCLEVDALFEASRVANAPSPALFVYTLPSMFQGEIAIQYRLRGRCTLLSAGRLSSLTALATGARWVDTGRAKQVLVVAAEAAAGAAQALGYAPQTAAAAWLLGQEDGILGIAAADAADATALTTGALLHGCTFVDSLETLLLARHAGAVQAEADGRLVRLQLTP